jgi:hypothetical protein
MYYQTLGLILCLQLHHIHFLDVFTSVMVASCRRVLSVQQPHENSMRQMFISRQEELCLPIPLQFHVVVECGT